MPKQSLDLKAGIYVAEEKYDGHRLIVEVSNASHDSLFEEGKHVRAWGRYGIERILPKHVVEACQHLHYGTYDGELMIPGKRSYGVTEIINGPDLVYVVFDLLECLGEDTTDMTWDYRRQMLMLMWQRLELMQYDKALQLAPVLEVATMQDVRDACQKVWARDGEGLILKRRSAHYHVGKRPKDVFIKIKKLQTAILTVQGYVPGKNGPVATVALCDDEGNLTTVKTLDNKWLSMLAADPQRYIGRKLRIEFQERTPDGNYRHPRWDRWEDE